MTMHYTRPLLVMSVLFGLATGAPAQQTERPPAGTEARQQQQPRIEEAVLVRLVRSILIAVNNANLTGNYTVLRDLGSPSFAGNNTAATLAERFKPLREGRVELSPILVLPINLSRPPAIDSAGRLDIEGVVPTRPLAVSFRMRFEPIDGAWRMSDLALGLNATEDPDQQESDAEPAAPVTNRDPESPTQSQAETPQSEPETAPAAEPPAQIPLPTPKPDNATE